MAEFHCYMNILTQKMYSVCLKVFKFSQKGGSVSF